MRRSIWQAVLVGLGFALGMTTAATADVLFPTCTAEGGFDSTVDTPNTALSGFSTGPYGEICITLTSSTTANVEAETFPGFLMGASATLALEVNATSFTATTPTGGNGSPYTLSYFPKSSVDGFGNFDFVIDSFDGFTHASSTLDFTLTDLSGTWASAANVLTTNASGADAAMHIFVSALCSAGQTCTGFAAEGPGTITENPEPGVLSLLGIGLLGFGVTALRLRRKT